MPEQSHEPQFISRVADALHRLPGIEAVALGGSRAQGTDHPDSDWDVAVYYHDGFDPELIRALGWPGRLWEIGGWGPVFNGGGKLTLDDQQVDIHYRDLGLIDRIHDEALRGSFTIEPLRYHQAGLPSYILLAELALNHTLRGHLPRWDYPPALRRLAPPLWWDDADCTLSYANGHARHGRIAQTAGLLSEAACLTAHAVLARRGVWVTNEKQLLNKAGLKAIDDIVARLGREPETLAQGVADARALLTGAIDAEGVPR